MSFQQQAQQFFDTDIEAVGECAETSLVALPNAAYVAVAQKPSSLSSVQGTFLPPLSDAQGPRDPWTKYVAGQTESHPDTVSRSLYHHRRETEEGSH